MSDFVDDVFLERDELDRLRAVQALLAPKPAPRLADPEHQTVPEWAATKLHLRVVA
jgi:hypothetical protein